jgi:hypothetical protein
MRLTEDRRHARIVPRNPVARLVMPNAVKVTCRVTVAGIHSRRVHRLHHPAYPRKVLSDGALLWLVLQQEKRTGVELGPGQAIMVLFLYGSPILDTISRCPALNVLQLASIATTSKFGISIQAIPFLESGGGSDRSGLGMLAL